MFFSGFIVAGSALVVEVLYAPPYWVHVLWGPDPAHDAGAVASGEGLLIALQYHHKAEESRFTGGERPVIDYAPAPRAGRPCGAAVRARGIPDLRRARHLANPAQGLEGSADRNPSAPPSAPPTDLPPRERWARLDPADGRVPSREVLRRVRSRARRRSSIPRPRLAQRCVRTRLLGCSRPLASDGGLVVVNRGFVPRRGGKLRDRAAARSSAMSNWSA